MKEDFRSDGRGEGAEFDRIILSLAACSPELDTSAQRALLIEADALYTSTANAGDVEGLTAHPLALEVSEAGDMGYTLNLLELSVSGEDGSSEVQWLRDFHVWRMGPDGAWRIVEDIWHVLEQAPSPEPVG